jgi:acetyltransferase
MLEDHFLHRFLNPKSIAIIGASGNPLSVNYHLVSNLVSLGYKGRIYPVNPKGGEILGLKTYRNINEIEDELDLVAVSVPARSVLPIVQDFSSKRISNVVLITGGFSEIGEEGRLLQDEIAHVLTNKGIRTIGPNALSPINSYQNLAISFFHINRLPRGNVSFVFQSGMYEPRFNWILSDYRLGVSKLLDLGNKMDITEVDALEYLAQDPETSAVLMHLEVIKGGGRRFFELLRETTRIKPVIVLKGGRTDAGARAAMSHTGSLVQGNDAVFDAALKQAGALRAETLDDFLYYGKAFSYLPALRGNRIALATFPGGEAVLATDMVYQNSLVMARPGQSSYEKLRSTFPAWEIALNPYDFGIIYTFNAFNNNHGAFIEAMADDENVDCIGVQLPPMGFPIDPERFCPPFLAAARKGKPLVIWPPEMLRFDSEIIKWLEAHSIPVYPSAAVAIKVLAALNRYREYSEAA